MRDRARVRSDEKFWEVVGERYLFGFAKHREEVEFGKNNYAEAMPRRSFAVKRYKVRQKQYRSRLLAEVKFSLEVAISVAENH